MWPLGYHWKWVARNRFQLLGGLGVAIVLPGLLRSGLDISPVDSFGSQENTVIGTFLAMLFGAYLRKRMTVHPGTSSVSIVLPAFGAAYGLAVLAFFFLRVDYSRAQFGMSFVLVLIWFALIARVEPHIRRHRLLVLPFGRAEDLLTNQAADWIVARSPQALPPRITGVAADLHANLAPEWERLLSRAALSGLPVYHWKQIDESLSGTVDIERLANLGSLLPSSVYLRLKRLVDTAMVVVTLPLTLPIAVLAAVAILICDGRPILFRQTRTGFQGRQFVMLKLRTMPVGSEHGQAFTEPDDPRVTRLGRILRHYHIDELPQIINILKGEMSWIGPRPESHALAKWYEGEVPFYSYRHIVRPGITGWAQVHQGNVAQIKAATGKLRYDFYYIKYFSPWLDLAIVAKTVRIVLTGFGSR